MLNAVIFYVGIVHKSKVPPFHWAFQSFMLPAYNALFFLLKLTQDILSMFIEYIYIEMTLLNFTSPFLNIEYKTNLTVY